MTDDFITQVFIRDWLRATARHRFTPDGWLWVGERDDLAPFTGLTFPA